MNPRLKLPCILDIESTIREWLVDPRGKVVFEPFYPQMEAYNRQVFGGVIEALGPAAEGVRLPAAALLVPDLLAANDPQKAVVTAYKRDYEARYKSDVSTFGGHAYDGLMLIVDAIKRAGSTDKAKVRDALEATKGYVGTRGVVNMSATDHMGLDLSAFVMLEVKGGAWSLVR